MLNCWAKETDDAVYAIGFILWELGLQYLKVHLHQSLTLLDLGWETCVPLPSLKNSYKLQDHGLQACAVVRAGRLPICHRQ